MKTKPEQLLRLGSGEFPWEPTEDAQRAAAALPASLAGPGACAPASSTAGGFPSVGARAGQRDPAGLPKPPRARGGQLISQGHAASGCPAGAVTLSVGWLRAAWLAACFPLAFLGPSRLLKCWLNQGQPRSAGSCLACLFKPSLPGCTNSRLFIRTWVARALTSMPPFYLPRSQLSSPGGGGPFAWLARHRDELLGAAAAWLYAVPALQGSAPRPALLADFCPAPVPLQQVFLTWLASFGVLLQGVVLRGAANSLGAV